MVPPGGNAGRCRGIARLDSWRRLAAANIEGRAAGPTVTDGRMQVTEQPEKNTPSSGKRVFIKIPERYHDWPNERQHAFLQQLIGEMAEGPPAQAPTRTSPEELWNEAVQALVRCDAAEFLSEEYMAESRAAQDLFEQAAQGFAASNRTMAQEAAKVVAKLALFNSVEWGDPADVETSNEKPVFAEDGITLTPPRPV